ncbi:hypothetical protein [Streptomyces sp. NPDC087294]|uniref:hypothetical protein n=1 Tax=Streptomyces sp. NPDC087294 TaxID=3365777 RepID=UPI00381E499E
MGSPASRYAIAGAAAALLVVSGCSASSNGGAGGGGSSPTPTSTATASQAAARDKGPVCVGAAGADGVHVLRGGGFRLPGGGGVRYDAATADGRARTAILRDGARYAAGQKEWTVRAGQRITVSGHAYTVSQICSYRVVLQPQDTKAKAALAAAPNSLESKGGTADNALCFTTAPSVRAAAAKGFPAKGHTLSLLDNSTVTPFPTGLSLTVSYLDTTTHTAGINANCAATPVALYKNLHTGDTLELAGVLFTLTHLTDKAVQLTRTSA